MRICLFFILFSVGAVAQADTLLFPRHDVEGDARQLYGETLLKAIVAPTQMSVAISDWPMTRARMEIELTSGQRINIMLLPERPEYNEAYLKVPVAVDNGLIGQRVALVRADADPFANVTELSEVANLVGCTGSNWTVTRWYESNGFQLQRLLDYDKLFVYTERGGCDYFSRSVLEIEQEFAQQQAMGRQLKIDQHVLLQVPVNQYYYLSPAAEHLLAPLTQAVQLARQQGVIDRFLQDYTNTLLESIDLDNRRVIELNALN